MIHVAYSNRTEELLAALARNLREERRTRGPFAPARIVVPNRNVETYVKLGLAEALGVAANLEVAFLRGFLTRTVERVLPGARAVMLPHVEGHLLAVMHDDAALAHDDLTAVREYLRAAGERPDAIDLRRVQLAAEVAQLFDEYAASRPELLAAWAAGRLELADDPVLADMECWQRALWRAVFARDGLLAARSQREGIRWAPLPELVAAADSARVLEGGPVHMFGVSYVARGYHRMMATLARHLPLRVYTLNPCREFWEDVDSVAELRRRVRKEGRAPLFPPRAEARQPGLALGEDPLGVSSDGENLALRLWGKPGRENVRLLNQLTDGDFEGRFLPSAGSTRSLLGRVQDDVLDRARPAARDAATDASINVIRAPGVRRELETVAAEIWRLARADRTLRLNEVAVIIPEARKELYLPQIAAVFGEAHGLPHNVADLPLGGGHRLGEAALLLLGLPLGSFTRRELVPLLTHPAVMARFPEATPVAWLRLCDELGIVHGADRRDHAGTYIVRDLLNWDQGLRRLALGALVDGPRSGNEQPVAMGGERYLPAEVPPDEEGPALAFALLARSLLADARFAAGCDGAPRQRPLGEWLELMRAMLTTYLVPGDEQEQALLGRCLGALGDLDDVDLGAQTVSYRVAYELAERALTALTSTRGQYLAGGVTVASFVPMRAIPFRAVFVVGLGHGVFPRGPRRNQLDLRGAHRQAGDVSPREQDLYMFLETLLCARDSMTLSYVARDELTGEPLPPSSVLLELREVLAQYLPPDELAKLWQGEPPPLRRWDETPERLAALPLAGREQEARAMGVSLRAAVPAGSALPDLMTLRRALPDEARVVVETRLRVSTPPAAAQTASATARIEVPLSALRLFLEDPLQGSARFRLRMREVEGEDELAEREDEAFATGARDRTVILRESMMRALLAPGPPRWEAVTTAYRAIADREELAGRGPTGLFRDAERATHEAMLAGWWAEVEPLAARGPRKVVRFGRAAEHERVDVVHDPIELGLPAGVAGAEPLRVALFGRTDLLVPGERTDAGSLLLLARRGRPDEARRHRDRLRAFFDHLALSAAGLSSERHAALLVRSFGGDHDLDGACFAAIDADRARGYLTTLVTELLTGARDAAGTATGVHDYLLPCEAVFASRKSGRPVSEEVEALRDAYYQQPWLVFSSVLGPVPEAVERHEPPARDDAERLAQQRFGLYFDLLEAEPQ